MRASPMQTRRPGLSPVRSPLSETVRKRHFPNPYADGSKPSGILPSEASARDVTTLSSASFSLEPRSIFIMKFSSALNSMWNSEIARFRSRVKKHRQRELERGSVILEVYPRIRHSIGHPDTDVEPLHGTSYGIVVSDYSLLLLFRKELEEIAHVHKPHVQFIGLPGDNGVPAFYICSHALFLFAPRGRRETPLLEQLDIRVLDVTRIARHLDEGVVVCQCGKFHIRLLERPSRLVEIV